MKPKFKVGDILRDLDDGNCDRRIVGLDESECRYIIEYLEGEKWGDDTSKLTFSYIEEVTESSTKKIKATKIARKLNKGKIVRDLGDYIEVKCE